MSEFAYELPSARAKRLWVILGSLTLFVLASGWYLNFKPWMLVTEWHHFVRLAGDMLPPDVSVLWRSASLYTSTGETLSMALLGTVCGGTLALAFAFLAASNTTPHPMVRGLVRGLFALERATPNIIVLLVLLVAMGFGPFAGMIALSLSCIGMFGRLFADAIEQVDHGPGEAVTSVGASRLQVIRFAVLPQVLPAITANLFYAFDVSLRSAIALGIYGGGGLGYELALATKVLRYRDVLALVLVIILLITLMERASDAVRSRLLASDQLR